MRWVEDRRVIDALRGRSGGLTIGHLLGVVQSGLWLGLLAVAGGLLWLGANQSTIVEWPSRLGGPRSVNARALLALGLAIALLLLIAAVGVDRLRRSVIGGLASRWASILRVQAHRQIYRQGQSALPTEGISPAVELFTDEVDALRDGAFSWLDGAWRWPTLAAGLVALAMGLSWQLALFLLAILGLVALAAASIGLRAVAAKEASRRDADLRLGLLQEDLGLVRTVRVYGIEGMDKRRFDDHLEAYGQAERAGLALEDAPDPALSLLAGVGLALGVGLVSYNMLIGRIDGVRGLLLFACLAILPVPWVGWRRMRARMARARQAAGSLGRFLDRRPELLQNASAKFLAPMRDQVSLENVTVEGPSGRLLLEGVSLQIPARTRTAIMGRDEDSKHALACLIPRLLDPKVGRIRIDGLDLRDVTLDSLRAQVATVLQSDLVFSDTVAANIGLGDPSYELPRIVEAAKAVHAHHFIQDLANGYETYIGPMGQYLRLDELYRIALARAYLHDPSIVVIEEPLGGFDDEEVKHLTDDAVNRLAQGRTLIFLPHRLSTIRTCQQVIVLHNGRIEAIGPPRELQAESKVYRHLQYVEFNQFAAGEIEAGQMGD